MALHGNPSRNGCHLRVAKMDCRTAPKSYPGRCVVGRMDERRDARERLVERLQRNGEISSPRIIEAMRRVPRHMFVPEDERDRAYEDKPVKIGHGQVVTAPHLVGRITELLDLVPRQTILEIGTGSGYHAAVLAELVGGEHLVTVERVRALAMRARRVLERVGYGEVAVVVGDGSRGLPCGAPYDRVNVTCAAPGVPASLLDQLGRGGRMTIPVGGTPCGPHTLCLVKKHEGQVDRTSHGPVRFVPLVGANGFPVSD